MAKCLVRAQNQQNLLLLDNRNNWTDNKCYFDQKFLLPMHFADGNRIDPEIELRRLKYFLALADGSASKMMNICPNGFSVLILGLVTTQTAQAIEATSLFQNEE